MTAERSSRVRVRTASHRVAHIKIHAYNNVTKKTVYWIFEMLGLQSCTLRNGIIICGASIVQRICYFR